MGDVLISKTALYTLLNGLNETHKLCFTGEAWTILCNAIENIPPAKAVPPVEWIPISDGEAAECPTCGQYYDCRDYYDGKNRGIIPFAKEHRFCPKCGSRNWSPDSE